MAIFCIDGVVCVFLREIKDYSCCVRHAIPKFQGMLDCIEVFLLAKDNMGGGEVHEKFPRLQHIKDNKLKVGQVRSTFSFGQTMGVYINGFPWRFIDDQ